MIDQKKDIYELICSSRCVVTGSSSSALDALMTGTPVITVDMMGEYNEIDFIKDGLTLHATDYNQLRGHMLSVIDTHAVNYQSPSGVNNYFFEWQNGHYSASNFIANYIANTCVE
jgi:predicted glycosyltransferase